MNDERERIARMLAEGRISADEAEQLLAAVEKAESEEERAAQSETRPRLSRLALVGVFGVPAAAVVWALVFGFGIIFTSQERAAIGASSVAWAMVLTGLGLSTASYVLITRKRGQLRGAVLARVGVMLPSAVTFGLVLVYYSWLRRSRDAETEARQRALEDRLEAMRREVESPERPAQRLNERPEETATNREAAEGTSPRCYVYVGAMRREVRPSEWPMRWFSPEGVDKIELRFREQAPVPSASAVAGETSWPFAPGKANVLVLSATPQIRAVWQKQGGLVVQWSCGADEAGSFALRTRPEAIAVDEGTSVTVVQRRSKDIPGSRGYLELHLGDITAGQVLVSIRTAEGETIVDTTSVRRGEEVPFTFGGEKYVLRVVELVNLLVGDDFGTLMVLTEGDAPEWRKIERLLALVESSDLTFIRNDKEYTPAQGAAHLRSKLRVSKAKVEIHTVEDFIDKVASRSFTTGRPYSIKLPDGKTVEARAWLHEQAAELEAPRDE